MNLLSKDYLSVFMYFLLFNMAVLTLTVTLHELGHLFVGISNDCSGKIVLIDTEKGLTYTELQCDRAVNDVMLSLGCFIFVVPLAFMFLLLRMPEKNFFYVILGIGASTSSMDIVDLFHIPILLYIMTIIGTALVVYGEFILVNKRFFMEENYQKL